jgi:peroxiredoxin
MRSEALRATLLRHTPPLGVGDHAPDFSLPDQSGKLISLQASLTHGPVVLLFYRGGWCPFCTLTLRAMQSIKRELSRHNVSLLSVSPQIPAQSRLTAERNYLDFAVLSDDGNTVARRYGLAWQVDDEMRSVMQSFGHDLVRLNGSTGWELPFCATYVINQNATITAARITPGITDRMDPAEIINAVRELAAVTADSV